MQLIISNKNWILFGFFFICLDIFGLFLLNVSWVYFVPFVLLGNLLLSRTVNLIYKLIFYYIYYIVLLIGFFILNYLKICGQISSTDTIFSSCMFLSFGFIFTLLLKICAQMRIIGKHGKTSNYIIFTKNEVIKYLIKTYDETLITEDSNNANLFLIENANEFDKKMFKNNKIISFDCESNFKNAFESKVPLLNIDSVYNNTTILVIANDENIIHYCKSLWLENLIIVTDNEELARKYNCKLYTKSGINDIDAMNPRDIILDFYMINSYNICSYYHIIQDLFKNHKQQKILLSVSRQSALLDVFIYNIFKEILWCKLAKKNTNNIVIPFRTYDILSDSCYSITSEIKPIHKIILNNNIKFTNPIEIIHNSCNLIQNVISSNKTNESFIYEYNKINPHDTQNFLEINNINNINIHLEQFWFKITQTSSELNDNILIHQFPSILNNSIDFIVEKFLTTGEFNIMELINIIFVNN